MKKMNGEHKYPKIGVHLALNVEDFVDLLNYFSNNELKVLFNGWVKVHTSVEEKFDDEGIVVWESVDLKTKAMINYSTNCYDKNIEGSISILAKKR